MTVNKHTTTIVVIASVLIGTMSVSHQMERVKEAEKREAFMKELADELASYRSLAEFADDGDIKACREHWGDYLNGLLPEPSRAYSWKTFKHYHDDNDRSMVTVGFDVAGIRYKATCWAEDSKLFDQILGGVEL